MSRQPYVPKVKEIDGFIKAQYEKSKRYYYASTYLRHLTDLENLPKDQYRFNYKLAQGYVFLMQQLKHHKGEKAGQRFVLEDWQIAAVMILGGWERKNGKGDWVRRFKRCLWMTSRKSGKTFIAAGFLLVDTILRPEAQYEIACCATQRDQAKIGWDTIYHLIQGEKSLKGQFHKRGYYLLTPDDSKIYTVGRDSTSLDGLNVSHLLLDELHAHPNSELQDVLTSSMGARKQPFTFIVSTAGFNPVSPLVMELDYAKSINEGDVDDPTYFYFLAIPDKEDEMSIEAIRAANPNIGVSVSEDYMLNELETAKRRPEARVNYLTKYENRFVNSSETFISLENWKGAQVRREEIDTSKAKRCIIGLDLSISSDFTAITELYIFDNMMYVVWNPYTVDHQLDEKAKQYRAPLTVWRDQGYLHTTPNKHIDQNVVYNKIVELIREAEANGQTPILAYDPYRAREIIARLESEQGFTDVASINQGYKNMNEALQNLQNQLVNKTLKLEPNPVSNWMISNVEIIRDSYGNMKPDRQSEYRKIDLIAALLNALYVAQEEKFEEASLEIYYV